MASVQKRNGKWQARVRRAGHATRAKSFISRTDALRWVREAELELDRSGFGYDHTMLERTTVADLLTRYRREITPTKRGHASEAKRIDVFLRYPWTALTLARVTPQTFAQHRDRRSREVEAGTVIRELGLLHTVFEIARQEWDIPLQENPIARVRKPRAAAGRKRRLEPNELTGLLQSCSACRSDWLQPGILLAIETAMRRGEILNIRLTDIDTVNCLLSIPETKTDTPRTIPLTVRAVEILSALAAQAGTDGRLFPISANAFRLAWERCKGRTAAHIPGITDLRFHDLRHEAVSRLFELGLSVPEVASISGHKDPRMLFRYTHLKPQDIVAKLRSRSAEQSA